jgi:hypothetical protein
MDFVVMPRSAVSGLDSDYLSHFSLTKEKNEARRVSEERVWC